MHEPWKKIICSNDECQTLALDEEGRVRPDAYLYPEIDNALLTQFTCPRCGSTETWGLTRRKVAKLLYDRLQ